MDHTAVIEKIKKLLAFAADTRGNPHEIEAAARQAQAMLRKYSLQMADVITAEVKRGDGLEAGSHRFNFRPGKVYRETPVWASMLASTVAEAHDCGARLTAIDRVTFYGYSVDVQVAVYIYEVLLKSIYRNCPKGLGVAGANGFRLGAVHEIRFRYLRERQQQMAEAVASRALVVVKQEAIEKKFGQFSYRKVRAAESAAMNAEFGYSQGRAYGKTVNIRQTGIAGPNNHTTEFPSLK